MSRAAARLLSLVLVLVLVLVLALARSPPIDYEHRLAEYEHDIVTLSTS